MQKKSFRVEQEYLMKSLVLGSSGKFYLYFNIDWSYRESLTTAVPFRIIVQIRAAT